MASRIYVAAPYIARVMAEHAAILLEQQGYEITQPWWKFEGTEEEKGAAFLKYCAELDMRGIRTADAVLLINSSKSEGKAVEQGLALAYGIPIIAIGTRGEHSSNVFHYLANYYWVDGMGPALDKLKEVLVGK